MVKPNVTYSYFKDSNNSKIYYNLEDNLKIPDYLYDWYVGFKEEINNNYS